MHQCHNSWSDAISILRRNASQTQSEGSHHLFIEPISYLIEDPLVGFAMGIDALYFTIIGRDGIIRASAPTISDVLAAFAFPVHIFLKLAHTLACSRAGQIFLEMDDHGHCP